MCHKAKPILQTNMNQATVTRDSTNKFKMLVLFIFNGIFKVCPTTLECFGKTCYVVDSSVTGLIAEGRSSVVQSCGVSMKKDDGDKDKMKR